jgi:hypothetical protein
MIFDPLGYLFLEDVMAVTKQFNPDFMLVPVGDIEELFLVVHVETSLSEKTLYELEL